VNTIFVRFIYQRMPIISGFLANGIGMLLGLISAPIYIKLLGIESYGLVGFYITLQATLQVFDFGISPTMTRELARFSVDEDGNKKSRDFVRSLESIYWGIGIGISLLLLVLSPSIAHEWLKVKNISDSTLSFVTLVIISLIFIQWPLSFYQGALIGLNRQTIANTIGVFFNFLRFSVSLSVLFLIDASIESFFLSQFICSLIQILVSIVAVWSILPKSETQPKFDFQFIRESIQFSVGVGSINVLGLLLTQMDKIILSTLLSLEQFGYYVLASTVGRSISIVTTPVFNYIFPKFSTLVAEENQEHLSLTYRTSNQLMIVIAVPLSITIAFFAPDILTMWTHNSDIVTNVSKPTSILVLGTGLNSLMMTPYLLHLAYGETRRWFFMTMGFAGLLFTFLIIIVPTSGTIGASSTWLLLNSLQVLVGIPLTCFYLLPKENVINLFMELLIPICMSGFLTFIMYSLRPVESWLIPYLLLVYCLTTILSILFCSNLRQRFLSAIVNL
jgi:O-antigen/teichoic acid export membrane protein